MHGEQGHEMALVRNLRLSEVLIKSLRCAKCRHCICRSRDSIKSFQVTQQSYDQVRRSRHTGHQHLGSFYRKDEKINDDEPRTAVEESKEDFKHVLRLIPNFEIPDPPQHAEYPTPSGWSPPKGAAEGTPYAVRRTKFHQIPVYTIQKNGGNQILTYINKVEGDIWAFAGELSEHINKLCDREIPMQINEYSMRVTFKGAHRNEIMEWVQDKGF